MRRLSLILAAVFFYLGVSAQEMSAGASAGVSAGAEVLLRLKEANFPSTLEADFTMTRHSPLLTSDLVSKGRVYLAKPDCVRWEVVSPKPHVTVFNGADASSQRRFRLPADKDFRVSVLEGERLSVILEPLRGDFRKLFSRIVVKADPGTYIVSSVLLSGLDGDSTFIEFSNIRSNVELSPECFVKQ